MTAPPSAPITSSANPRVKAAVRLRERHAREARGLTLVDGARELLHALDAGVAVDEAFVCRDLVRTEDAEAALARLEPAGARVTEVSPAVLGKVAFGDRSDGLVAVVRPPERDLSDLALPTDPLVVVVEAVEKPGNLGAILRTADGAGADALVAADPLTDLFNPNTIRASLGTIFRLPVASATSAMTIEWLAERTIRLIAARVDAPAVYTDIDLRGPIAIVLGSEATGLSSAWDDPRVTPVRIPMHGAADSLNVSVAAAVLLYEAVRQRG
ncbi:MAG TPA: RNA methyltransferase [Candidatus Limnocylindrales bacterium]|nr:RNA methyltransferase [Candidatus Limnocylindrales bacterium]